jgi:uncharacterized membrane protein YqjE
VTETARASATHGAAAPGESLFDLVKGLLHELPGLLGDRVELFALEMHRAGMALARVLALTVMAAIVGVTAWLAAWTLLAGLLVQQGWHWSAALGLVILINLGGAAWALRRARQLMRLLSLPATRRHLSFGSDAARQPHNEASPDDHSTAHSDRPAAA